MWNMLRADTSRIFRGKGIYVVLGAFILLIRMHAVGAWESDTSHLSGSVMLFYMMERMDIIYTFLIPILYFVASDDFEHGVVKNAISGGVSRTVYYFSKFVLGLLFCTVLYGLQIFGSAGLTTWLHGFGAELNADFLQSVFSPAMAQLFTLWAMTAVGILLVFWIRKSSWFAIGYTVFLLGPATVINFLVQRDASLYFLWDFELLRQTIHLLRVSSLPTYEILLTTFVVSVYFFASMLIGLTLFKKSEIK